MTIQQLLIWSKTIPELLASGILTTDQVGPLLKSLHPSLTDDEIAGISTLLSRVR